MNLNDVKVLIFAFVAFFVLLVRVDGRTRYGRKNSSSGNNTEEQAFNDIYSPFDNVNSSYSGLLNNLTLNSSSTSSHSKERDSISFDSSSSEYDSSHYTEEKSEKKRKQHPKRKREAREGDGIVGTDELQQCGTGYDKKCCDAAVDISDCACRCGEIKIPAAGEAKDSCPTGGNPCVVPDAPTKGSYSFPDSQDAPVAGSTAQESQILYYECPAPNVLQGGPTIICENGKWLPEIPRCLVPSDCGDILGNISGVYLIQPSRNREPFDVYCDLTLDGQKWIVIQQRLSKDIDFYKNYTAYSNGFGTKMGNHWLGLEHIHEITKGGHHELYVELDTYTRKKVYARYDTFIVGNSSTGFQLTISGYNGTAGDSMYKHGDSDWTNNGMKFTTYDKDQDEWSGGNCAEGYEGGWWYNNCGASNLNGPYEDTAVWGWKTIFWLDKFGYDALKRARMLIRRK